MISILSLICIFLIGIIISYKFAYWFMIFLLAIINSNAQYNESDKRTILKLAQKDKVWRDVAKILELESEVN